LLFLTFKEKLLFLIYGSVEDEVYSSLLGYSIPILLSMPGYAVMASANAVLRSQGEGRTTMLVSGVVNIVNLAGNAILLFVFDMGAMGVGIASCASRYVGAAIMLFVVTDKRRRLFIPDPLVFTWDKKSLSLILSNAIPVGIEKSLFHVGKILISSTISTFGTASIAAYAVFGNMETIIDIPGTAMGLCAVTLIGQCCGAQRYKEARHWAGRLILYSYLMMWCTSSISFLAIPKIINLYSLSPEAVAIAVKVVRLDCINRAISWPLAFVTANILHGTGDARTVMAVSVAVMWVCRVMLAHFLGVTMGLGLLGTQMGMWADWYVRMAIFVPRFLSGKWETKGIAAKEKLSSDLP
ncbi:MAG: MATE family efflux transporter, partial [Candidatus Ornithospirochaeta sp.]